MSVEFRQRKPAEYGRILWRRKWMIALPAAAVFFAVAVVVWKLPNVYQSTTLLIVRPSSLAEGIVPRLSDDDLTIRINNIGQEVFSRSTLEPLIVSSGLYATERRRGEPMELLIERMKKKDIQIELSKSRNDITNGFQISFKGPTPQIAQQVTSALAGKYIGESEAAASKDAQQTLTFITTQAEQALAELQAVDQQRYAYLTNNLANLPSTAGPMVQRLTALYEQQKGLVSEIGRLRDQQTMLTTQLAAAERNQQTGIEDVSETLTDPKTTLPWAELTRQESQFESEVQSMLANGLRPKHPDVAAKRQELAAVQRQKKLLLDEWKEKVAEKTKRLERRVDPSITTYRTQLQFAQGEIARQEKMLAETRGAIGEMESRINRVPKAEVDLGALDREYQTKKTAYDELLDKKQKAELAAAASKAAQGEKIALIDPANLPEKPVAPKRPVLMGVGLVLGLGLGLLFAAAFEVPRLLTVQTVEDARHYTSLPVLVAVPELLTAREQRRRKLRRLALAAAGLAAAVVSVPALALLLKLSNVFERLGT